MDYLHPPFQSLYKLNPPSPSQVYAGASIFVPSSSGFQSFQQQQYSEKPGQYNQFNLQVPEQPLQRSISDLHHKKRSKSSPQVSFDIDLKAPGFATYQSQPLPSSPLLDQPGSILQPQVLPPSLVGPQEAFSPLPSAALPSGILPQYQSPSISPYIGIIPANNTFQDIPSGYNQPSATFQNPYAYNIVQDANQPFTPQEQPSALSTLIASKLSNNIRGPVDVTNRRTKKKNTKFKKKEAFEDTKYKFNSAAFQTPFHKSKIMNYLQIVTHQRNNQSPITEYLLLRPFSQNFVSQTGLKVDIDYDNEEGNFVSVYTTNVDPTTSEDYVGVRNVGVITDMPTFFAVVGFIPLPMAGGRTRRPQNGERAVPLETFRGWSSLLIMESKHRGILF